jgi:hypothetical protein
LSRAVLTDRNPRHLPLSPKTAARVQAIAAESAVDGPLAGPSRPLPMLARNFTLDLTQASSLTALPDIFIADIAQPDIPHARQITSKPKSKLAPIHHIDLHIAAPELPRSKRKRRAPQPHPPARFWAPPVDIGGKARGYGWGYRDSFEGRRESGYQGYVRSKGL